MATTRHDVLQTYRTTSLDLATALKTVLRRNPSIRVGGRLAEFSFPINPEEAQRIVDAFYGDQLSVNPRQYSEDLRTIKAMIFQARG